MKIDNEFAIDVPVERAWEVLTDLEGLAPCLPGAELTGVDGEVYSGKVRVKVGPVISQFAGTARFVEKDAAGHHAVVSAKGKDSRGGGNASATIDLQLRADSTHTVVTVATNLNITGKLAQFGSGMIKEISAKLLNQFVHNLEERLHVPEETAPPAPTAPTAPEAGVAGHTAEAAPQPVPEEQPAEAAETAAVRPAPETQPLDLMGLAGASVYKRLIPAAVAGAVLIALIVFLLVR